MPFRHGTRWRGNYVPLARQLSTEIYKFSTLSSLFAMRSKLASVRRTAYDTTMFVNVLGVLIVMGAAAVIVWLSWITMWLYYKIVE